MWKDMKETKGMKGSEWGCGSRVGATDWESGSGIEG
jgi:hypothetical protein